MKNFGLTRHERNAILFLVISFLAGASVKIYRFRVLDQKHEFSAYQQQSDSLNVVFQEKSKIVNQAADEHLILTETDVLLKYPVNINTDSLEMLIKLPNIGPVLGHRIIDYRENHGAFRRKESIKKVKGVGEKTYQKISKYIAI